MSRSRRGRDSDPGADKDAAAEVDAKVDVDAETKTEWVAESVAESWVRARGLLEARLAQALALEHGYPYRMPSFGRESAVLAVFGVSSAEPERLALLLTERSSELPHHASQVAFPGGVRDSGDASLQQTALREAEEETGIVPEQVQVLGMLPVLNTVVTGFLITPVVGVLKLPLEEVTLSPSPREIARADWVEWREILDPARHRQEMIAGRLWKTDVFEVGGMRVWGATAAIVRNLVERWRRSESEG
jgi:8-oxo-dGTP pyrophosphatase MutT (NUDIX family)